LEDRRKHLIVQYMLAVSSLVKENSLLRVSLGLSFRLKIVTVAYFIHRFLVLIKISIFVLQLLRRLLSLASEIVLIKKIVLKNLR